MKIDIALTVTHRFECLNVLLDILKNNFKNEYVTHVFCNLNENDFASYKNKIDFTLIDHFHHIPDDAFMKQNTYESEKSREKYKRIQPLKLIKKTFLAMSCKDVEKFIYTECDCFPLIEDKYISYFYEASDEALIAAHTHKKSPKSPNGFILPSPIYLTKKHASLISNAIVEPILPNSCNFEGRLMTAIKMSNTLIKQIDENFPNNSFSNRNLFNATESTHQHNILNLRNSFIEFGIDNGKWINQVLNDDRIHESHSGVDMEFDHSFRLEHWNVKC